MNDDGADLPLSWCRARIGDVADVNPKALQGDLPTDGDEVHFVPMSAVAPEFGGIDVSQRRAFGEVRKGYTQFSENDVLLAKITPCMENGKLAIVPPLPARVGFGSTEFHVLRSSEAVQPAWLAHYLSQQAFRKEARQNMTGSAGQLRVSTVWLSSAELPVPPAAEQTRIVLKLEELLSDLDAGVAELKAAQAKLQHYRQSLLKAAVEGSLTRAWREAHPAPEETGADLLARILRERRARWEAQQLAKFEAQGKVPTKGWQEKYPEPVVPRTSDLPSLPRSWTWATLSQIGWLDRGRSKHRPRNAPHLYGGPYPFVQTGDIRHADTYLCKVEASYSEAGLAQSRLWPESTLCITIAANIGKTAILGMAACFPDSVVGFLPASDAVSVRYVDYFMRRAQAQLEDEAPATAQKNINLETLERLCIPLPPEAEMREVVEALNRAFDGVKALDTAADMGLKQSTAQRQNLLRAAFAGQLVPQDPADEPASALLARLRAERAAARPAAKRSRSKKGSA